MAGFSRFNLPYDEYLPTLQHLRSFQYDFVCYDASPIKAIEHIIKSNPKGKFLINFPAVGSNAMWASDKYEGVKQVLGVIKKTYGALRGTAKSNVEAAIPGLAALIAKHAS